MFRSFRTGLQRFGSLELESYYGSTSTARGLASKAPRIPGLAINDNMMLQKSPVPVVGAAAETSRPLVLLLSWLVAKEKHVNNFSRIYLDRGCDVLVVKMKPMQILLPQSGSQVVAQRVVDFLQLEDNRERPIFVHSFSVGGYLYAEILQKMMAAEKSKGEMTDRIIGQIYDSVVDLDKVAFGIANALFSHKMIQKSVEKSIDGYLAMMYRPATQHYARASRLFYNNPVKAPSLFFYSYADPVGCATAIENCVQHLRTKVGHDNIYTKSFQKSRHVSHMHKHKEEYLCSLFSFLKEIPYFDDKIDIGIGDQMQNKAIKS
ncbi:transmembrane protein 53-like [Lytechinus variegatus]|uniref:transmembrane protein 53-like n=1 Tax=Lytechinus variegatus TaxID=7654 RepID=UPI001BB1757E|nr:transmembrane protein 53-like [Lytechinus variegatus]